MTNSIWINPTPHSTQNPPPTPEPELTPQSLNILTANSQTQAVAPRPATKPTSAQRQRKLHIGHFAFMRAAIQGLDLHTSWQRYLKVEGDSSDRRLVSSTIMWIRQEFVAASKRHDRFGTARLVRLDVSKIPESANALPSLDEFAESRGIEDFSQAEQIAAYEAEYGVAAQRLKRREQLILRQLEAIKWLENLLAQPPRAKDAVVSWLHPTLTRHLEAANILTLQELAERINGIGKRWYAGVGSLGSIKAQRILEWMREHEATTHLAIGTHVELARSRLFAHELATVVAPATAIRPIEKFIVPAELDGSKGIYRRPQAHCLLKAHNDYQAILAWLGAKQGLTPQQKDQHRARRRQRDIGVEQGLDWLKALSHTQRAYRKEAERFLLWAVLQKKKPLSSMSNEDCVQYRDFLADPQPRSHWCGEHSRERWSPLWRPFKGPLMPSAQCQAIKILKNLYAYLVDQNYLMGNPWSAINVPKNSGHEPNAGRSLSIAQWAFVQSQLAMLPTSSSNLRLKFAIRLLYATGLRRSEVVAARVDDLRWVEYPGNAGDPQALQGWILRVIGKGQKVREVPVPNEIVDELGAYLESRGLEREVQNNRNRGSHLLGMASDLQLRAPNIRARCEHDPRLGIDAGTLYNQIKTFFSHCANVLKGQGDLSGAERLAKASTHWLRHSHASHAIARGMPIEIAQQNLGHASLATTTAYVTTEEERRMRAMREFWDKSQA